MSKSDESSNMATLDPPSLADSELDVVTGGIFVNPPITLLKLRYPT